MHSFMHNYLLFDEFGIRAVRCMACGTNIKSRSEIKSSNGSMIRELSKHADYREIPVLLDGGKLAFIMVCDGCKFIPIEDDELKSISWQLEQAFKMQLEFEGKLPDLIDEIVKVRNFKVLRKAEVQEVTSAYGGVR